MLSALRHHLCFTRDIDISASCWKGGDPGSNGRQFRATPPFITFSVSNMPCEIEIRLRQ